MNWHYKCPLCGEWRTVPWVEREQQRNCHQDGRTYYPPSPAKDHRAYVDTHDWPTEMEETVVAVRGSMCTVPNCNRQAQTLDHRVAWTKGGRTSVENLFPMCTKHNQEKGDQDYQSWLAGRPNR